MTVAKLDLDRYGFIILRALNIRPQRLPNGPALDLALPEWSTQVSCQPHELPKGTPVRKPFMDWLLPGGFYRATCQHGVHTKTSVLI